MLGQAGFSGKARFYNAEYNARPHVRKETTLRSRAPAGNTNLLNHQQNMTVRKCDQSQYAFYEGNAETTMGAANYGNLSGSNRRVMIQGQRLTSDVGGF